MIAGRNNVERHAKCRSLCSLREVNLLCRVMFASEAGGRVETIKIGLLEEVCHNEKKRTVN